MNWNNENVIKFIEAYKEKPVLWDPSHKSYYNRNLKQEAWDELSVEMECPVGELKKKMDYLLAALRREKSKIAKTSTTGKGADEVYQSSWFAFKYLQFLMDRNKPRPRINTESQDRALKDNTSENEENDDIGGDYDQLQDKKPRSTASTESDQTTDNAKNSSKSQFKSPLPKKKKYAANQNPMLQSAFDLLKSSASAAKAVATASTAPATGLDQYQLYVNYLAGKFRGYSKQTYMTVEHQINNILYNADCGQYEYQRGYSTPASNRAQSLTTYMTENQAHSPVTQVDDSSMDSEDSFRDLINDINY